jgi:hypothetical protein
VTCAPRAVRHGHTGGALARRTRRRVARRPLGRGRWAKREATSVTVIKPSPRPLNDSVAAFAELERPAPQRGGRHELAPDRTKNFGLVSSRLAPRSNRAGVLRGPEGRVRERVLLGHEPDDHRVGSAAWRMLSVLQSTASLHLKGSPAGREDFHNSPCRLRIFFTAVRGLLWTL